MDDELYDDSPDPVLHSDTQSEAKLCVKRMLGHQLDTDSTLAQYVFDLCFSWPHP